MGDMTDEDLRQERRRRAAEARARYEALDAAGKRDYWVDKAEQVATWGDPSLTSAIAAHLQLARYWGERAREEQA